MENDKLLSKKSRVDKELRVLVWWRKAPTINNLAGKLLAGIEFRDGDKITIGNGGIGSDFIRCDYAIAKYVKTAQEIWEQYKLEVPDYQLSLAKKVEKPTADIEIDVDFAAKLKAHDWFYFFSDSAGVYRTWDGREKALEREAQTTTVKAAMWKEACAWRSATTRDTLNKPDKPVWLQLVV